MAGQHKATFLAFSEGVANAAGQRVYPSLDIALGEGPACEAVRALSYWPGLYDTLVAISVEDQEYAHCDLGGEG